MQAIILGDPHIGKNMSQGKVGIGASLNSRVADQLNLLEWTLDQAIEKSVDHIIITGDVFEDPKPHTSLITMFISWLKKCQVYNIHVHIILGNHDMLRSGMVFTSSLDLIDEVELENVSVYKDINTIFIDSTAITFMPFRDRKSFNVTSNAEALNILKETLVYELAIAPVTYKKIIIGHFAIEGSIPIGDEIDDMSNELFCPLDMFSGYDYVWMGHVHKPQVMKKNNPHIAHVGSMDISNFGETDHKKHIIIFNCSADSYSFELENLPIRSLRKISIEVPKDIEDTTSYVIEQIKKDNIELNNSIVKVEISLMAPELKSVNKKGIEKYLTEQGAFNITNISESKKISLIKKNINNTIDIKMNVSSAIKTYAHAYVDACERDSFIELAMDIFNTYKVDIKE